MILGAKDAEIIQIQISDGVELDYPIVTADCTLTDEDGNKNKYHWKKIINISDNDKIEISRTDDAPTVNPQFWYEITRATPKNYDGKYCTFCNKKNEEVKRLIDGPNDIYVCDECVQLMVEILDEDKK